MEKTLPPIASLWWHEVVMSPEWVSLLVRVSLSTEQHLGRSWQLAWCLGHNRCFRIGGQKSELNRERTVT